MAELNWVDWTICGLYLAVVAGLALASARNQRDNETFFVGGRSMNWAVVGISLFATSFSSLSFLGLPQRGAYQDFSFYLTILFIPLVITPILWFVFVPVFVKLRVSSCYEYLGRRFGVPTQRIGSILYCLYSLGGMGSVLYAVTLTLQIVLGLSDTQYYVALVGVGVFATAYTALGGLKAVIWTDVLQAVVLGGAIALVLFLAVGRIDGGWGAFFSIASEHDKFQMIHQSDAFFSAENFSAKNSIPTAIAFALFMYLPGYAVSQQMSQRYVCAGSLRAGRGIVALSGVINTILPLIFMLVGTALFAFYTQEGGPGLPAEGAEITKEDQILPYFIATQFAGVGLAGVILAGLFAAAMSTIDSGINGVTSVIIYDWMGGRAIPLRISRYLTVVLGILVVLSAILAPQLGDSVLGIITTVAGITLGTLMAIYLLGLFVPRANQQGVLIGLGAGLICLAYVWTTDISRWYFGGIAMLPTFVVGWLASLMFPAPHQDVLAQTTFSAIRNMKEE